MTPLSNYPREMAPAAEPFRVWRGDLVFGVVGLLDLIPGSFKIVAEILAGTNATERLVSAVLFTMLMAFAAWLEVLTIFRKRWGMWLLLALSVLGIVLGATDGFADARKDRWDALSLLIELGSIAYLPLRLFGKVGPRPR